MTAYLAADGTPRGCGESSVGRSARSRTATVGGLVAVIRRLGGPVVIAGHPASGGAATMAVARESSLATAAAGLGPFILRGSARSGGLG